MYEKQKSAEGEKASADAALYARQQAAEADLYAKKKEAEGIMAIAEAQGASLNTLLKQLGGSYEALRDYIMLTNGSFLDIAKINSQAVQGLNPKISVWSTGSNNIHGGGNGAMKEIAGIYSMLPPLLQTVNEQTGMLPPPWLGKLTEPGSSAPE